MQYGGSFQNAIIFPFLSVIYGNGPERVLTNRLNFVLFLLYRRDDTGTSKNAIITIFFSWIYEKNTRVDQSYIGHTTQYKFGILRRSELIQVVRLQNNTGNDVLPYR